MLRRNSGWELLVASLLISVALIRMADANDELDALTVFRQSLTDPRNMLKSWDPSFVHPCTWFYITCNGDNQVTRVNLYGFNLSGHLVPELGNLQNLQILNLYENNLDGTIPPELGKLTNLNTLLLQDNNLSGEIPPALGNMRSLKIMWLQNNQLTGRVPDEVKNIPGLQSLDVSGNHITG